MGGMLKKTKQKRAKGTCGQLQGKDTSGDTKMVLPENIEPTLADMGLSKKERAK
jgi:hypothetical protein